MRQYDVVLLPEPKLAALATAASVSLARFGTLFSLDNEHAAHMSVYYGVYFSEERLAEAVEQLRRIAAQTRQLHARADHFNQAYGYVGVHYQRAAELLDVQMKIITTLNPLRSPGPIDQHTPGPLALANIELYGWEGVGDLYAPHMTFTRFADRSADHLDALPDVQLFSGAFAALAVFELGPNGTCIRKAAAFDLRSATRA